MILKTNIPLRDHSNFKIGGNAKYFVEVKSKEELVNSLNEYREIDPCFSSVFVLGKGTNVLFKDEGYDGLIIKNEICGIREEFNEVEVASGELMQDLVISSAEFSLSGFEWAGGLPGSVGGAIRGNAGAFGGEIKDNLLEVTSLNMISLKTIARNNLECRFNYRNSVFKYEANKEFILSAKFSVKKDDKKEIESKIEERVSYRKDRHPLQYPNLGSMFKNIPVEIVPKDVLEEFKNYIKNDPFPVIPVAKLIASTKLMGRREGDAQISEKHPNFIVNLGSAKASDVLILMNIIKEELKEKYRVSLEEEIMIL
jgi:UDP-N-acetylmuramate dehydrogenase